MSTIEKCIEAMCEITLTPKESLILRFKRSHVQYVGCLRSYVKPVDNQVYCVTIGCYLQGVPFDFDGYGGTLEDALEDMVRMAPKTLTEKAKYVHERALKAALVVERIK